MPKECAVTQGEQSTVVQPVPLARSSNVPKGGATVQLLPPLSQLSVPVQTEISNDEQLTVGRYVLTVDVEGTALLLQGATKILIGSNFRSVLQSYVNEKKIVTLPLAGKDVRFDSFAYSPKTVNGLSDGEEWRIGLELLQNPVPIGALVTGVCALIGISIVYISFRSIERVSEPVTQVLQTGLPILAVIGLAGGALWLKSRFIS